ncbi:B-cell antigen receptor complex-associated protein beta chain [Chanos chanos]|uniref:B-cell antigen receptor complex-associated protein beta chain n=1 Tax=Chanos chanos TaxID=29144 RepID=A0A6J2VG82_CHACN|nr:B-cell antigen receptor complex-associated protein beta chain [Chanos chanos]
MHYLVIGCTLLALVNVSDNLAKTQLKVFQKPRFYGITTSKNVIISCSVPGTSTSVVVEWFKSPAYKQPMQPVSGSDRIIFVPKSRKSHAAIKIMDTVTEDSGIYICKANGTLGPGTELQVHRRGNLTLAIHRSKMKDAIIFIQGFLLVILICVPLFHFYKLEKKEETIYEEPEDDHTYEGLEIEHCGLYEDIPALSQGTEAVWSMESPDQE